MQIVKKLDIIIVNYNTKNVLKDCLCSIERENEKESKRFEYDTWVIDNASSDGSTNMIKAEFPNVRLVESNENIGFSKANNKVINMCSNQYILLLNPDTIVQGSAISDCLSYMKGKSDIGVLGCKVLNKDGTLQLACRRSIPTPDIAFARLIGLSKLFPNSKRLAKYNLTYIDEDEITDVDAVSGAFMMVRRSVVDEIGLLDERFFMFGEELDWCFRFKKAGYRVVYYPQAQIIHLKGESIKSNPKKSKWEFYRAMYLFHKKHWSKNYFFILNWIIYSGIFVLFLFSKIKSILKR